MLKKSAFTLIEVLVVVAILALLTLAAIVSFGGSRDKADDSRVKSDLDRLKIAFEDYYSDHNCYPPLEWFDSTADCGSDHLQPYLNVMPCNRKTGSPTPSAKMPPAVPGSNYTGPSPTPPIPNIILLPRVVLSLVPTPSAPATLTPTQTSTQTQTPHIITVSV